MLVFVLELKLGLKHYTSRPYVCSGEYEVIWDDSPIPVWAKYLGFADEFQRIGKQISSRHEMAGWMRRAWVGSRSVWGVCDE